MSHHSTSFGGHIPLSMRQSILCAGLGAVLWFFAALLIQWLGPMGVFEGYWRLVLYGLVIPGTAPFIWLIAKVAGLARHQIGVGVSVATMIAVLLDGVALAWLPDLYGGDSERTAAAGAVILWGAGVGMAIAWLLNRAD